MKNIKRIFFFVKQSFADLGHVVLYICNVKPNSIFSISVFIFIISVYIIVPFLNVQYKNNLDWKYRKKITDIIKQKDNTILHGNSEILNVQSKLYETIELLKTQNKDLINSNRKKSKEITTLHYQVVELRKNIKQMEQSIKYEILNHSSSLEKIIGIIQDKNHDDNKRNFINTIEYIYSIYCNQSCTDPVVIKNRKVFAKNDEVVIKWKIKTDN